MKFRFPGFKILDRYILGKFLSTYFFAIAMIIVIVVIFDYAEKIDDFTATHALSQSHPAGELPELRSLLHQPVQRPVHLHRLHLLHLEDGLSDRNRRHALGRNVLPTAHVALLPRRTDHRLALADAQLWVIPRAQSRVIAFQQKYIQKNRTHATTDTSTGRSNPERSPTSAATTENANQASFFVLERYEDGEMVRSLEAADARFDPETKRWTASRYTKREFTADGGETFEQFRNLDTLINLEVAELGAINDLIQTMNISELNRFLEQQRAKGSDSINIIEVEKHARYAYPLSTFILTLIGVSLSSRKVRGGTGLHIGIGTGLCFSYILFNRFFEEFAKSGTLPTGLAVWLPNIIYLFIAVYLYRKAPK